jgi:glucokinase
MSPNQRPLLLGIDIGGTKVALGIAGLPGSGGELLARSQHPAATHLGPSAMLERIVTEAKLLLANAGGRATAIGISCGGPLDRERGVVLGPPNLPGWTSVPIVERLSAALGAPATLDNDANLAALGEQRFGAGRGYTDLLYLTISTGIGGGILQDGRLVHGLGGSAGELGHQTLDPQGPLCGCGNRGCLEALASGSAIAREAQTAASSRPQEATGLLARAGGDPRRLSAGIVAEAAGAGDALALELWNRAMGYLGIGIANAITILAPQAVILGGGMSSAGALLFEPIKAIVRERVRLVPIEKIALLPAALGLDSPLRGALAMAAEAS